MKRKCQCSEQLGSPQGFSLSAAISTSASKEDVDGGCPQRPLYKAEDEKAMGRGGMGMGSSLYFVAQATAWESNPTREDNPAETPLPAASLVIIQFFQL